MGKIRLRIGYLKQNNALDTSNSINDEIKSVFADLIKIGEKLEIMRREGRLDAEYYQTKYDKYCEILKTYNTTTIPQEYYILKNSGT